MILLSQQGSGSRFLLAVLSQHPDLTVGEEIANKDITDTEIVDYIRKSKGMVVPIKFRHIEGRKKVINEIKKQKIILLRRDPCHTWTRDVAKYKEIECWRREQLIEHVEQVLGWYEEYSELNTYVIDYESFGNPYIKAHRLPTWLERELLRFLEVPYRELDIDNTKFNLREHIA